MDCSGGRPGTLVSRFDWESSPEFDEVDAVIASNAEHSLVGFGPAFGGIRFLASFFSRKLEPQQRESIKPAKQH